jgi:hypothetical protein
MALPEKFPIRWMPDLYTAQVGHFNGREQFFLAHHRAPSATSNLSSNEYVALYRFDGAGTLTNHEIVGPLRRAPAETVHRLLTHLGPYEFTDICVSAFQVVFDGHVFGLIPDASNNTITLEPGAMITLMGPWDGEYYT